MRIGIISDTHGYIDERICAHLQGCEEIWHAGDIGDAAVTNRLSEIAGVQALRAVHGNIDGSEIRHLYPETQLFVCEGLKICMIHIAGSVPRYTPALRSLIRSEAPDILVCGHSHILKVSRDEEHKLLYINPGAAGRHGFHQERTLLLVSASGGKLHDMSVVQLGKR